MREKLVLTQENKNNAAHVRFLTAFSIPTVTNRTPTNSTTSFVQACFNMICFDGDFDFVTIFSNDDVSYHAGIYFAAKAGNIRLVDRMTRIEERDCGFVSFQTILDGACAGQRAEVVNIVCERGGVITEGHVRNASSAFKNFLRGKKKVGVCVFVSENA